ncbi:MAG: hypothetical protein LBS36_04895 [Oscillospiraceae bacterium]|jgi:hypothetical protein|nr:hypothetical protein [Oscillospiraceae bacterium]
MFLSFFQKQSYYLRQTMGEIDMKREITVYIAGKARAPPVFDFCPQANQKSKIWRKNQ